MDDPMTGFGWNFYLFFIVAAVWVAAYFLWARRANRRSRGNKDR